MWKLPDRRWSAPPAPTSQSPRHRYQWINASLKLPVSGTLQIVDRPNRNVGNAVPERESSSYRAARTREGECANVDDVKKLES